MDKLISESFLSFFANSIFFYFENISFTFDKRSFRMRTHFVLQILKNTLGASFTMDHKSVIFLKSTNSQHFVVVFAQLFYKLKKRFMKSSQALNFLLMLDYSMIQPQVPYYSVIIELGSQGKSSWQYQVVSIAQGLAYPAAPGSIPSASKMFFRAKIVDVAEVYQRQCMEKS